MRKGGRGECGLILCFNRSLKELEEHLARRTDFGSVWLAWPKKASGVESDLSEKEVQKVGLDAGLVDYKVCSIDEIWSGLKFTHRKGS
jgi:hypothetical protein